MCTVYIMDAHFALSASKFVAGTLAVLSAMVLLETAHVSVLSKVDLLTKDQRKSLRELLDPEGFEMRHRLFKETGLPEALMRVSRAMAELVGWLGSDGAVVTRSRLTAGLW